jgi:hypothetical protein
MTIITIITKNHVTKMTNIKKKPVKQALLFIEVFPYF